MKKSKKLSLQSLALVLMSLILVVGVAFGMTGAWFQDTDSKDAGSITMGKAVNIKLDGDNAVTFTQLAKKSGDGSLAEAMPGDVYEWAGLSAYVEGDSSAMYLVLKIEASETGDAFTLPQIDAGWTEMTNITVEGAKYYFQAVGTIGTPVAGNTEVAIFDAGTFELDGETLTNSVAGSTISIKGSIHAIQQANVELSATSDADAVNEYFADFVPVSTGA